MLAATSLLLLGMLVPSLGPLGGSTATSPRPCVAPAAARKSG